MNFSRKDITVTEPLIFDRDNCRLMNLIDDGTHEIRFVSGAFQGVKLNGVQVDPDDLPSNWIREGGFWGGPNYQHVVKKQAPEFVKINSELGRGGKDAKRAWIIAIDVIHADAADLSFTDFKVAYAAQAGGNMTYSAALINALKPALPDGWGWEEVRDWINSKSREFLVGEPVPTGEVWE